MKRAALALAVIAVVLTPTVALLLVAVLLTATPGTAACQPAATVQVGAVPNSLTARTSDGVVVTLGARQLDRAAVILDVAGRTRGVGLRGGRIALMAALTESGLRMLANPAVPASLEHPNDGTGRDHDSVGLFQMRPSSGWGTVSQLMGATYQAEAFFGGPDGPNTGSPAGLLDVPHWAELTDGEAAQAVEVSAYPDRYARFGPVADRVIRALTTAVTPADATPERERSEVVFPLPTGAWTVTARFGPRVDPITGRPGFHHGTDLAAPAGTTIRSATAGRVVVAGMVAGTGTITVLSTFDGRPTAITYLHMTRGGIGVRAGERVSAGEVIGAVGSSGHSTGPHLHFEVQPGGLGAAPVDSLRWLRTQHASGPGSGSPVAQCD